MRATYRTGTWLDALNNRVQLAATIAMVTIVPVAGITALFVGPSRGWLARTGAIAIALADVLSLNDQFRLALTASRSHHCV